MGGAAGAASARISGSSPCISSEALPMQPALTNARRSMSWFPIRSLRLPSEPQKQRSDYDSGDLLYNLTDLDSPGMVTISFALDTLSLRQKERSPLCRTGSRCH